MSNNNYVNAQALINGAEFTLKGLKTFMGMDCPGINANLYYNNKKVAQLIDDGNGGCLNINWVYKENGEGEYNRPKYVDNAIIALKHLEESLPTVTWKEVEEVSGNDYGSDGKYTINDETICNELIDNALKLREFNKLMKKISVLTVNNEIANYKAKSDQLSSMITVKGVKKSFRDFVNSEKDVKVLLNDLPTDEAFALYKQYA